MIGCYCRVSTSEQAENGNSISEQQDRMRKYCESLGWNIYDMYVDAGFSGAKTDRPSLQRLIKDVESHKVDKVLVYKLDRLSRSQKDTLMLIDDVFLANGCDFVSMSENFDTSSPFGRAMIGILAVFAQLEREQIRERMCMGREARAKNGQYIGSRYSPLGYDYIDGQLVTNEFEKLQVIKVFNDYANGKPPQKICNELNDAGMYHKNGKWKSITVREIISKKTYLGYVLYNGHWYKGNHEAFIDKDLWDRVKAMKEKRYDQYNCKGRRIGKAKSYLGGYLVCGQCGEKFARLTKNITVKGKVYNYVYYGCKTRHFKNFEEIKCQNKYWKMEELDSLIFDEIRKLSTEPLVDDLRQDNSSEVQFAIEKKINALSGQIDKLMTLFSVGGMPLETLQDKIHELNDQKISLETELKRIETEKSQKITKEQAQNLALSLDEILKSGDFDQIRSVIESLIDYIEIDGDNIVIHWEFT